MKKICITGVSSGIGKSLLEKYKEKGYSVDGVVRHESQKKELIQQYPDVRIYVVDLGNVPSIQNFGKALAKDSYDIVIFNAGYGTYNSLGDTDPEEILPQTLVNFYAPIYLTRIGLENFIKNKTKIVFISSIHAGIALKNISVYAGAKSGLSHFYRIFRREYPNIFSLCIEPGATKTPMHTKSGFDDPIGKDLEKVTKKIICTIAHKQGVQTVYWDWWIQRKIGCHIMGVIYYIKHFLGKKSS